jgi:hypothetical protein
MVSTFGDFERPPPRVWTQLPPKIRRSSNSLRRIVGVMFTRVNAKCAHQVRPPPGRIDARRRSTLGDQPET